MAESTSTLDYMVERLNKRIANCKLTIRESRQDLSALQKFDPQNADYVVRLHSLWADCGERTFELQFRGSVADAVRHAEAEFRILNNRSDVQADYFVALQLNGRTYNLPEDVWRSYL